MLSLKDKRGDASSYITTLVIVFFLAVTMLIAAFVNVQLKEIIDTTSLNSTSVANKTSDAINNITTNTVHRGFAMIVGFLLIGMMISSYFVRVHPAFLFIYIIVLAISLFVAIPLSNTYQLLMSSTALNSIATQQTMITWIMQHLVGVMLGAGAITMVILFSKLRNQTGGYGDDV